MIKKASPVKRLLIVSCVLLGPVFTANAQVGQHILKQEYSVEFFKDAIVEPSQWAPYPTANYADEWQALLPPNKYAALVSRAEGYVGFGWPVGRASVFLEYVQNGNRTRFQKVQFSRRQALVALVIGEMVEGKGRFLNDIVDGIWAISEETFWGVPAHLSLQKKGTGLADVNDPVVDLFAAETAQILAWTSYLLGDSLDTVHPLIRERIYVEIDRRIFKVIESRPDYRWMGAIRTIDDPTLSYARRSFLERRPNNWNPWINSNLLTCILLLEKDRQRRAEFIHQVFEYLDNYLEPHPADGGSDEGTSYWGHAAASTFDSLDLVSMATQNKFNEFGSPLIKNMGEFITKAYVGSGYYINFADASPRPQHSPMLVYRFGKAVDSPAMMDMGGYLATRIDSENAIPGGRSLLRILPELFYSNELLEATAKEPLLGNSWLPDIQLMISRDNAASTQGLLLAAKAGHNEESHNHNDVGSFIIFKDGNPAIIDVGGATYTSDYGNEWVRESAFHNLLPAIDGQGQLKGKKHSARNVSYAMMEGEVVFSQDIAGAYGEETGVQKWERVFRHEKGGSVVISDSYEFDAPPESIMLPMMFNASPDISNTGQVTVTSGNDAILTVTYDAEQFDIESEEINIGDKKISGNWGDKLHRVHFKMRTPFKTGNYRFVIE
jgi:hypothetical protein